VLGFYLTSHPLSQHERLLKQIAIHVTSDLHMAQDGSEVLIGGMISAIKKTQTKKPSRNGHTRYANFDFEDVKGVVRCIMWPEEFSRIGDFVQNDAICFLRGKVDRRGREPNLIVEELVPLDQAEKKFADQVAIKFDRKWHDSNTVTRVNETLRRYPGRCTVAFVVDSYADNKPVRVKLAVPGIVKVAADSILRQELIAILGEGNVQFTFPRKRMNSNGNGNSVPRKINLDE